MQSVTHKRNDEWVRINADQRIFINFPEISWDLTDNEIRTEIGLCQIKIDDAICP